MTFTTLYEHMINDFVDFDWSWNFGQNRFASGKVGLSELVYGIGFGYDF
jgi:hypothetical protein